MQAYRGVVAYHLTTVGEGIDTVEQALLAAGLTFTRTPVTVAWPGGRGDGAEFVFVLPAPNQRTGLDLVQRLRAATTWLQVRTVDGSTPA
ncbi:hypothetical protein AB0K00_57275 [Dactylosporangium sp. NPDC049525]|uniref:hypothetical protein n=1 Tax=Dactylosporangium sp. NPDC049525 TaxID=3154730 RepID=UPI0034277ADD